VRGGRAQKTGGQRRGKGREEEGKGRGKGGLAIPMLIWLQLYN